MFLRCLHKLPGLQMDAGFLHVCLHLCLFFRCVWVCVCAQGVGCPWIALKNPREDWWKGSQQVLLATQHTGGLTAVWCSQKVVPKRRRVKGRGWVPVGGEVGRFWSLQCAGTAFSMVANKVNLFIAIQRCKLLFIKVSHSAFREQNVNAGSLARTVSNTPVLCPL